MFDRIPHADPRVVAFDAIGTISDADYKDVLIPALEDALDANSKVRALIRFGEAFEGYNPHAMVDDTVFGISHLYDFERIAVASDIGWIRHGVAMFAHFSPMPARIFPADQSKAAFDWLTEDS